MSVYRPSSAAAPPMPPPPHPMGHHPHPIMPYPPPPPMGVYPHPPPHYMPGMPPYGPPPPPAPMPPLIPSQQPVQVPMPPPNKEAIKKDESAPAGQPDSVPTERAAKEEGSDKKPSSDSSSEKEGEDGKTGGLELLASLALPVPKGGKKDSSKDKSAAGAESPEDKKEEEAEMPPLNPPLPLDPNNPNAAAIAIIQKDNKNKKKKSRMEELDPKEKLFVEKVRECDVLCGRGGKSNHHPGNKRYRQVVSEMKRTYQSTGAKTAKTDLSRAIVEHVVGYGGRFIKRDETTGQYFLLTKAQARRKTSQALRETKELKWTM